MSGEQEEVQAPSWLSEIVSGVQPLPPRVLLYGGHAIGKSTLASLFPDPIFISTEGGLDALNVKSFPRSYSYEDVAIRMKQLIRDPHPFKTCVIDSADWLVEPLIVEDVEKGKDAKELAYGKGQVMVAEEFRSVLSGLDVMRNRRNMNIVITAHSDVKRFENPQTEPYDQFRPKLPTRCNALIAEWADVIGFCSLKVVIKKTDVGGFKGEVTRGVTTGDRLIHLVEKPAFVAKNRYPGGPEFIDMTIDSLRKYVPIVGFN